MKKEIIAKIEEAVKNGKDRYSEFYSWSIALGNRPSTARQEALSYCEFKELHNISK